MKRVLIHIFLVSFFFLIPFSVFAEEIEIVSITPIINDEEIIVRDETGYNFSVELYDSNQELSFNVVIKNTTNVRLIIRELSVSSPTNPNLQYSYVGIQNGDTINPNETKEFQLIIKSTENETEHSFDDNFVFNINYDRNEINPPPSPGPTSSTSPGNDPSSESPNNPGQNNNNSGIFDDFVNPQTGVFKFMVLVFIILVVVLALKIGKKKFHIFLFALLSLLSICMIQNVYAVNVGFSIRGHVIYKATYDVNIELNGGNLGGVEDDISCKIIDGESLDMSQFKKQYYHIDHLVINGETKPYSESLLVTKNLNISIVWERDYYYVTVDPNGGSYLGIGSIKEYKVAAGEYFEVQTPTNLSQVFREWQINPSSKRIYNGKLLVDCNISLKALWEDTYYTLTINPNGGSYEGISEDVVVDYKKNEIVTLSVPTKEGASFSHWEKGVTRHTENTIKMDNNYTLKAIYTDLYYDVRIDPNGGIYMGSSEIYTAHVKAGESIHIENITRAGYFFNNWIDSNGDYIISNDFIVNTNINLTAQWAISACRIGSRHFTSLRAAYSNAEEGEVITLLSNITGDFVNNKNITLDLNGYELNGSVTNNANLVVLNGVIKNESGTAVINNGILTLGVNDGVVSTSLMGFIGSQFGLEQNGTFYYYDGFIEGQTAMKGGYNATPVISGVTYYPYLGHNGNRLLQYIKLDSGTDALVMTETNGIIYFTEVQDGVNFAAINEYTLIVLRDFEYTSNFTIPADHMTDIDLNGKSPTFKGTVTNNGSLVIHDNNHIGELNFTGTLINNGIMTLSHTRMTQVASGTLINNKNHLILEDSTMLSQEGVTLNLSSSGATLSIDDNSIIRSISGTAIYNSSSNFVLTSGHILSGNKAIHNSGGSVTLSGGEVKASTTSLQYVYGVYNENSGIVKVDGGSIVAYNSDQSAYGVYNENANSKVSLLNGLITASETSTGYGIYQGTNTLTGGRIQSSGYGIYGGTTTMGVDDSEISSVSPTIIGDVYGVHSASLKVYDGIIKGKLGARASLTSLKIQENTGLFYEKVDEYYHLYLVTGSDFYDVDGVRYGSLATAYEAINGNRGTIKLVKSFHSDEVFPELDSEKEITFNLNGRTLTSTSSIVNHGHLIIQDTSEDHRGILQGEMNAPVIVNEGTLEVKSGKIESSYQVIKNESSGKVHLLGGVIQLNYETSDDKMAIHNMGNLELKGSTIDATCLDPTIGSSIIGLYNGGKVQFTSGNINVQSNGLSGYGILSNSLNNELVMTNGSISVLTGSTSYGISSGNNKITNGVITASSLEGKTSLGYGVYQGKNNIISATITGSSYGIYEGTTNLGVEDETLTIATPIVVGELYGVYGGIFNFYDGIIKGKTAAYLEESLDLIQNGTETYFNVQDEYKVGYLIVNNDYYFEVNEVAYNGFKRALHDVEENGTIKVIQDYTLLDTLSEIDKDVTIDLNGHIMSYNGSLTNIAHLTIIDSSSNHNGQIFSLTSDATINNNGTLTLVSGIISGDYQAIYNSDGIVNITGGQISMTSNNLVMYGIYNARGSVSLTGGVISLNHMEESQNTQMNVYAIYNEDIQENSVIIDGGVISINDINGGNTYGIYNSSNSIRAHNELISGEINVHGYSYSCGIYYGDNIITDGTISVQSEIGISLGIFNGKNTISSGNITVNGNNAANAYGIQGGTNTISGGSITSNSRGAMVAYGIYRGTNTISGGTISGNSASSSRGYGISLGTSIITGGNISGAGYGIYQGTHTLGENDRIVGTTTPVIIGELFGIYDSTINFYDGVIKGKSGTYRNSNFTLAEDVDTHNEILDDYYTYYMTKKPSFFEVDGIQYISFAKAYNAITGPEGTITVIDSIETTDALPTIAENKLVYLDLNGYSLNYSSSLVNKGTLIIRDSSEEQTGLFNSKSATTINNYGILNLEGGTLQSSNNVIFNQRNSFLNMNGGKIQLIYYNVADYAAIWNYGSINITGGEIYAANQIASAQNYYVYGIYNYSVGSVGLKNASITVIASQMRGYGICNENNNSTFNMMSGSINVTAHYNSYGIINGKNNIYGGSINAISTNTSSSYLGYGINGGNNIVQGGSIKGTDYGIYNATSTIGANDGEVNGESPEIIGGLYGVHSGSAKFYDGVLKGRTNGFLYETIKAIADNTVYNYRYEDGYQVYSLTPAEDFFEVNGTKYRTINDAYNSITGTSGTIKVLGSFFSTANMPSFINGRTITLDLNGNSIYYLKSLSNSGILNIVDTSEEQNGVFGSSSTSAPLITNNGTINLETGTLVGSYRVIENNPGATLNINGGEILIEQDAYVNVIAIYNSQAVINMKNGKISIQRVNPVSHDNYYSYGIYNYYNSGTKFTMSGGEIIVNDQMSSAYGIYNYDTTPVNNLNSGIITVNGYKNGIGIYSGTNNIINSSIVASTYGIQGGTNTIGRNDDTLSTSAPSITGDKYALNAYSVKFYDGILRGKIAAYNEGAINGAPADTTLYHRTVGEYKVCTLTSASNFLEVNGVRYNSFRAAYAAIRGVQGTIKVIASTTTSSAFPTIENGKDITIDLNGHHIVMSTVIQNSGTLTIDDTSTDQNGSIYYPITDNYVIRNTGTLNFKAGILSSPCRVIYSNNSAAVFNMTGGQIKVESDRASKVYGIYVDYGTVNISGGEVLVKHPLTSTSRNFRYYSYGVFLTDTSDARLNLTGGIINVQDEHYYAYGVYCDNGNNSRIMVDGGTINVQGYSYAYGIYYGTSTLRNVQLNVSAIENTSRGYGLYHGKHTLIEGTIYATGYGTYESTLTIGQDDNNVSTDVPTIIGDLYGLYSGNVTFNDGLVKGKTAATGAAAIQKIPNDMRQKHERIDDYDNLTLELSGVYLEVDGVQFNSFKKAYESIEGDTGTITVIAGYETESDLPTIAAGKHITLDLNGYEVVYTQSIKNKGELTITDTSEEHTGYLVCTSKSLPIVVNNGILNLHDASLTAAYRGIENTGEVHMDSGIMVVQSNSYNLYGIYNNGGNIDLSGGEIRVNHTNTPQSSSYNVYVIYHASNNANTKFTMTGGKILVNDSLGGYVYGIYNSGNNSINTIDNGEIILNGYHKTYGFRYGNNIINGGLLSVSSYAYYTYGFYDGVSTINNGEINVASTRGNATYGLFYGSTTINGGTINSTSSTAGNGYGISYCTSTIKGGTINASGYGLYDLNATLGVLDDEMNAEYPSITGGLYGAYKGIITFYDGIFRGKTDSYNSTTTINVSIDGFEIKKYQSGDYKVAHLGDYSSNYYEVNGVGYPSFKKAYEALPSGTGTIKILSVMNRGVVITTPIADGKNVTLDLNGKTLTLASKQIINNGTFTITDSSSGQKGKIYYSSTSLATINNRGTLNVQGGTVSSIWMPITNFGGTVNISGGTILVESTTKDIYGIRNDGGTVNVTGGTIHVRHTNTPQNDSYHIYSIYNTDDMSSTVIIDGGTIMVDDPNGGYAYAIFNSNDSNNPHTYICSGNININGYYGSFIIHRGTNEISGGIMYSTATRNYAYGIYYGINTYLDGALNVQGGTQSHAYGFVHGSNNISGGIISVTSRSGYYSYGIYGGTNTISGGEIRGQGGYSGYGIYDGTNTISGGEIRGQGGSSGYGIANGFNTITGGTISGSTHGLTGGTYTIGVNDSTLSIDSPIITGESYGISGGNVQFYDGIIRGKTNPYTGVTWQGTPENTTGYTETVGGYKVYYLRKNS